MPSDSPGMARRAGSLRRGQACLHCRRRKMKCDGQRPTCGPCAKAGRHEDCEYTDGQATTRTQLLEEEISRLEARIKELESPGEASSVRLFNPYHESGQSSTSSLGTVPPVLANAGDSASDSYQVSSLRSLREDTIASYGTAIAAPEVPVLLWNQEDPDLCMEVALVDNFLFHAFEFGFFLNPDRFRSSVLSFSTPEERPLPALLSAVRLLGAHVSKNNDLAASEPILLSYTVQQTSMALSSTHPQKVLHTIQAEVLISYYLFRTSRFLEGRYHYSAAVSLAIGSGLHRVRSTRELPVMQFLGDIRSCLPAPEDPIEEGERINGFWTVFVLDKCWSACLNIPSLITDDDALGTRIDTPWPLDMEAYEQGLFARNLQYGHTLQRFSATSFETTGGPSSLALLVRASSLFEQANLLNRRFISRGEEQGSDALHRAFIFLNDSIEDLKKLLPSLHELGGSPSARASNFIVAHTLAHATLITLYGPLSRQNAVSKSRCIASAKSIVSIARYIEKGLLNPVLGMLWMIAGELFIENIRQGRSISDVEEEQLNRLISVMTTFRDTSALLRHQLAKIQEAYGSI